MAADLPAAAEYCQPGRRVPIEPTYTGPACCVRCRETMDHARKLLSHLGEAHPLIIDSRLAVLARENGVDRHVELSTDPTDPGVPRPEIRVSPRR